ncbi:MAG: AAA family ATPase [Leptospiraceae bacterium]|nr:AAA family ATPase [Leptospiraceae bacterium]MCP5494231.1 AAA family ATPase [Leptospiraceae bacterium]
MLQIAYGEANFENLRKDKSFFVDKTHFIPLVERIKKFFFIRPRRFGKSLWISVLISYYDINGEKKFDELFDGLYIKENPTEYKNSYLVLKFDFSGLNTVNLESLRRDFNNRIRSSIEQLFRSNDSIFGNEFYTLFLEKSKDMSASVMIDFLKKEVLNTRNKVYTFIDEYDHFANKLASEGRETFVRDIISKTGFVREFYEQMKVGSGEGAFERFFITGVSPIMLDELASGFNIMSNMTTDYEYNEMLGFTEEEVRGILDKVSIDKIELKNKEEVFQDLVQYYNGYKFNHNANKSVFNSDMVMYFFQHFSRHGYPDEILDLNVKTDYNKLRGLIVGTSGKDKLQQIIEEINEKSVIEVDLVQRFNFENRFDDNEIKSLLYFFGLLTYKGIEEMVIPNYVIKTLFWEYLRNFLKEEKKIEFYMEPLKKALNAMAKEGNPDYLKDLAEEFFFTKLSSYDYSNLSEKHIKVLFISYFTLSKLYNVISERELSQRKRIDLLFEANPAYYNYVLYNFIVEFKYIRKTDSEKKAKEKRDQAIEQAQEYYEIYKRDFKQFGRELRSIALIVSHTQDVEIVKLGGF